jgi:predicted phage terminase large subunit-like protein
VSTKPAAAQSAQFEAGQIIFHRGAPWLPDLEAELLSFPNGLHDDQVDSISQALIDGRDDNMAVWAKLAGGR